MKILLLGEYSNVHNNLAEGLRALGHTVVLANGGHGWTNFNNDINLCRTMSIWGTISFFLRLCAALPKLRGYDVVQLINPQFLNLKAERISPFFNYIRKHNRRIVLEAMGDDYYYCYNHRNLKPMPYSDYNIGDEPLSTDFGERAYSECVGTAKELLTREVVKQADAIVAPSYEYWAAYNLVNDLDKDGKPIKEKLHFIPLPINMPDPVKPSPSEKLRVFIGYKKEFYEYKGADIMIKAAKDLQKKYPDKIELRIVTNRPFAEYKHLMDTSDVVMDQVYSYGPGMNGLLALSKQIVTISGGEAKNYEMMGEKECRPIVNVKPSYESVYTELEKLILMPKDDLQQLKEDSRKYVMRNHHYMKIAHEYENVYKKLLG